MVKPSPNLIMLLMAWWSVAGAATDPVQIIAPADWSAVSGTIDVTVQVDANYASGEIYVDGVSIGSMPGGNMPQNTMRLDTARLKNGAHAIQAKAFLSGDNGATLVGQDVVYVNVSNTDSVHIIAPADWSAVTGTIDVTIQVNASYTSAEIYVDGVSVASMPAGNSPQNTIRLDTTRLMNGAHTIGARAFLSDASGARLIGRDDIAVNVNNTDLVHIAAPADWAMVSGTIDVKVQVNASYTSAEIRVDGVLAGSVSPAATPPGTLRLDTTRLKHGAHTIHVRAFATDATGSRVVGHDAVSINVHNVAAPAGTLDTYGGRNDVVCTDGARPHFYREKIGNRWWLCTPQGHGFISISAYAVSWVGLDEARLEQKYGTGGPSANDDPKSNWAYRIAQRFGGWGFNSYSDYTETGAAGHILPWRVDSDAWPDGDHTIPIKMPYVTIHKSSSAAQRNLEGYAAAPSKGWRVGLKHILDIGYYYPPYLDGVDYLDPNWTVYIDNSLAREAYYTSQRGANSDWLLGMSFDDMDHLKFAGAGDAFPTVVRGERQAGQAQHVPHWGLLALIASPVHTVDTGTLNSQLAGYQPLFEDDVFYTKKALVEWLQQTATGGPGYTGIEALNASWGLGACGSGGYCSFGSQGIAHTEPLCPEQWDGVNYRCTQTLSRPPTPLTLRVEREGGLLGGDDASGYHPPPGGPLSASGLFWGTGVRGGFDSVDYANGVVSITFVRAREGADAYVYAEKITGSEIPDAVLPHSPIAPGTVTVQAEGVYYCQDDGHGNLVKYAGANLTRAGLGCSGAIDYASAAITGLVLTPALANQWVSVGYATPAPPAPGSAPTIDYTSGGWGVGSGLADEDGTCPARGSNACWMPAATWTLAGANTNMRRDLDNFLQHYAETAFSGERAVVQKHIPGALLFCNSGGYDTPAHAPVLRAMGKHCDVALDSSAFSQAGVNESDMLARYNHFIAQVGDMPIGSWEGFGANPDSHLFETADHMKTSPAVATTQATRAATYAAMLNAALNTRDSTYDSYHFVAWKWWALVDTRGEGYNWGLIDRLDNAYDGHETSTETVACSPPMATYTCGGDNGNWGDFLGPVTAANKMWLSLPAN